MAAPNSYRDPYWSDLARGTEQKLDLPPGLLVAVLTRGERSNADQVSEAGAKTPFQIIPATRDAAVKKWGIDPYLSPENAAEVAGLLLKDSLKRNQGDPALAVAEYHGGTDRANWGARTKAYVQRVVAKGVPDAAPPAALDLPPAAGPSTFQQVMAAQKQPDTGSIANVVAAYKAGKMTPEEAQQFEQDVQGGKLMLPRGVTLNNAPPATGPQPLPQGVIAAYQGGQMTPDEKAQLEADITSGAVKLPDGLQLQRGGGIVGRIPDAPQVPAPQAPEPGIVDKAIGTGEAALNVGTGMTGGALGLVGGTLKGLAEAILSGNFGTADAANMVEKAAGEGAAALTYQPRTQSGQDQAAAVGEAMQQALPVAGVAHTMPVMPKGAAPAGVVARAGAEGVARDVVGGAAKAVDAVAPGAVDAGAVGDAAAATVAKAADRVKSLADSATTLPRRALDAIRKPEEPTPTPGTMGSVGSAGTDMATQRRATAADLGFTGDAALTKGQATRDAAQLKFETETAKLPDAGQPLRQRAIAQNYRILRNFDTWVDQTGAEAPSLRATGQAVDKALTEQAARDKTQIRAAYKAAENAGEMEAPVTLQSVVDHLNEVAPESGTAPLIDVARKVALKTGLAVEGPDGNLVAQPITLKRAETFRQAISRATDFEPTNVRQSTIIKGLVDEATDGLGGNAYKQARALRARYAQNYEDRAVIAKLLNEKRGTSDRQVALEDVHDHAILKGSLDDVRNVRRVLQRSGEDGKQAWRELQGATANWIKSEATKNVATDSAGNRVVSPAALDKAIRSLDVDGKLDFVFGKQGAQRMRDLRDLAQYVKTVPPEAAVNTSNTVSALLAAFGDVGMSGMAGAPVPIVTMTRVVRQYVKDRALKKRIEDALIDVNRKHAPGKNNPPAQAPARSDTIH